MLARARKMVSNDSDIIYVGLEKEGVTKNLLTCSLHYGRIITVLEFRKSLKGVGMDFAE